jgi:hypothetical protein
MAFTDRKKQPHLWRTNPYPTPEQVIMAALAQRAAGVAVDFAERVIAKAFKKMRIAPPSDDAAPAPSPSPSPTPKKKAKAKAKAKS